MAIDAEAGCWVADVAVSDFLLNLLSVWTRGGD